MLPTYRNRKLFVIGAIGAGLALLVAAAVFLLMQYNEQQHMQQQMQESYEKQIEQLNQEKELNSREVWVASRTIAAGVALTADDLQAIPMPMTLLPPGVITEREAIIGKHAKVELEAGTPLLASLLYEGQPVPKDVRLKEFQVIQLPSNLKAEQFIDVRIGFPTGEDFVLLAKKKVRQLSGNVVWLEMNEMDILQTSSAIIDAYLQGARLYALPYIEPGLQEAAVVNYPANPKVLDLMEIDPNLLETAKTELARSLRQTLDANLKAVSDSDKLRASSGNVTVQQQLQNERATTRQGNAMFETQPLPGSGASEPHVSNDTPSGEGQSPAVPTPEPSVPSIPAESIAPPSAATETEAATDTVAPSGEERWEDILNQ
ncbi:flagellar basal body P-ring biosynthesis protein FlgA [Paenibacillus konkukensis]|uniref:Flagellar basal body P-ring biosynthesis protein FlgA n=1 Tax=Paenibacillus konkukensis TaxID=2020716 RepID=A0ABY4RVY3_9BACL|nr:SAF domain-containing protein [Paenibacillus konkukensis]UQZ86403.1 flagellar basal body P-ring biosynthesis protein FlgA [Paenibacillus konkukensis]